MASGSLMRCMGIEKSRARCEKCKRLPRNVFDEDAETWLEAQVPCEKFILADRGYLARHPEC
jgi:hypothetical protein